MKITKEITNQKVFIFTKSGAFTKDNRDIRSFPKFQELVKVVEYNKKET